MTGSVFHGFGPDLQAVLAILFGIWGGTLGLPWPEEIPLLTAGIAAAMGVLPLPWAIAVGFFACFTADLGVFWFGRRVGNRLHSYPRLRRILRGRYLLRARHLYKRGRIKMFVARLIPGLKTPFLFTAGAVGMPPVRFIVFDLVVLALLVPSMVLLAFGSGRSLAQLGPLVHRAAIWVALGALLVIGVTLFASWKIRKNRRDWRARCVAAGIRVSASVRFPQIPISWF